MRPPRTHRTPRSARGPRRGATLAELVVVCSLVALVAAIALPRLGALADRLRVRGAVQELTAACAAARHLALLRGQAVTLTVDDSTGLVIVAAGADTVLRRDLGRAFHVTLAATRDALVYAPTGLGYGASNLTVAVSRGRAADTVFVSRLGRVRW